MAGFALDLSRIGMGISEQEVRPFMVEGLLLNRRNVFRPALMFRVALLAFPLLLESPVKASLLIDVRADIFMAVLAELRLRGFVESLMACGASLFPLGMPFDHLARHERRLDVVSPGSAYKTRPERESKEREVAGEGGHKCQSDSIHIRGNDVKKWRWQPGEK